MTEPPGELPSPHGGPERLFAVSGLRQVDDGYRGTMRTGPWNVGPTGRPTVGSLGVLVDDVLALTATRYSPTGASVSTEITVDLLRPLPADGRTLTCSGRLLEIGPDRAFVRGEVTDEDGAVVAVATQRQRFVPARDAPEASAPDPPAGAVHTLAGPVRFAPGTAAYDVTGDPVMANRAGAVHGGLSLHLSAGLGEALLLQDATPLDTASIRIAHLRPVPLDATVTYTAEAVHTGRTLRLATITGLLSDGRLATTASLTLQ